MKKSLFACALVGVFALVTSASVAKADVVATFQGTVPSQTVNTTAFGSTINGMPVGPFQYSLVSSTSAEIGGSFYSFCADYYQPVNVGETYTYETVAFTDLPNVGSNPLKASRIQELFDRFYAGTNDAEKGGAFQLALWDLLFDGSKFGVQSLSSGDFQTTGSASSVALADTWLAAIDNDALAPPAESVQLVGLFNASAQDQITVVNPVPAPAGVILLVIGAGALATRRFTAKKAATIDEAAA